MSWTIDCGVPFRRSSPQRRCPTPGRRSVGKRDVEVVSGCTARSWLYFSTCFSFGSVIADAAAGFAGRPSTGRGQLLLHVGAVDVLEEVGAGLPCRRGAGEAVTAAERRLRVALAAGHGREREPADLRRRGLVGGQRSHRRRAPSRPAVPWRPCRWPPCRPNCRRPAGPGYRGSRSGTAWWPGTPSGRCPALMKHGSLSLIALHGRWSVLTEHSRTAK